MIDLTRQEEFEEWLRSLPTTALRAFATRAALQVLPYALGLSDSANSSFNQRQLLLACFRGNVVSGLVGVGLSEEASSLPVDALETLNTANNTDALSTLVDPNDTITAVAATFYSTRADDAQIIHDLMADVPTYGTDRARALTVDAEALTIAPESTAQLFATELWHGPVPEPYAALTQAFIESAPGTPWEFWAKWYEGMLKGQPLDWELQRRVALIGNSIWNTGPEAVAEEISRIQAEVLSVRLPQAESLQINPETGKFFTNPVSVNNPRLLAAVLTNVEDCLEDAVQGSNGLTKRSSEFRKIARTVDRYSSDPQQAELTLTTVANGIRRQIFETKDLPDSEDNLALLEAVEECVRGIRASHPEVAANREQLARQAFKELKDEDRRILEEAQPILVDISEGNLAVDFAEDIPSLINDSLSPIPNGAPSLPGADAATRIFSRTSRIALLRDKIVKSGKEVHDSPEGKTIRVGLAGLNLGDILYRLVRLGLQLLGVI